MGNKKFDKVRKTPGFAWRVSLSVVVSMGWLVFLIIWLFFYADRYTLYQNIAVFLVSILVLGAILGTPWAHWGIKYGHEYERYHEYRRPRKKRSR